MYALPSGHDLLPGGNLSDHRKQKSLIQAAGLDIMMVVYHAMSVMSQ